MPYQSENCVIHGYEFWDDYHDNDAFDFSHWENDDDSIVYFIPTIEDENELNIFLIAPYPPGVAVIAPGEILTEQIVQGLSASQKAGVRIAYATDPTLGKFRVVVK